LSRTKAFMGSLLQLRPLIEAKDGVLETKKVYRSNAKVLRVMKEIISESKEVVIGHILNPSVAEELKKYADSIGIPNDLVTVRSCSLSAHLGPGSYGIAVRR
jgi:fatty acid-binding protein DegV